MRPGSGFSTLSLATRTVAVFGAAGLALACLAGGAGAQRVWGTDAPPLAHYAASPVQNWPGPSYRAKDFTIAKVGDVYHLFYTRVQRYVPRHAGLPPNEVLNETCFGHAISRDLEHWTDLDTVLSIDANSNERHHVWAPTFVQKNGVSWLIYTGVTDVIQSGTTSSWIPMYQFICGAYSMDPALQVWSRLPAVMWAPCAGAGLPGVPWALCNPTLEGGTADFRDPYVLPPPAGSPASTPWLMYFTARPRTDQYNYVVGVAQSSNSGPGFAWTDGGALWDLYAPVYNSKMESPHVFQHAGMWNLFFSGDDGLNGIERYTALWPATGPWQAMGSIIPMLSGKPDPPSTETLDPEWWFASEYLGEDGPVDRADYFCFLHTYEVPPALNPPGTDPTRAEPVTDVEFHRMLWNADGTFDLTTPNPVRAIRPSSGTCTAGDTLVLALDVAGGARQRADFTVALVTSAGEQSVAPATVGLPVSVPLADGTITVRWPTRAGGLALPANLVVRMGNQPLRLDTPVRIAAPPGGPDAVMPEMPIVRVRTPGAAGSILTPGDGTSGTSGGGGGGQSGGGGSAGGGASGLGGPGPSTLALRQVGSTPAGGGIGFLVGLPQPGRVRLDVFDVLGRHVRAIAADDLPRGYTLESWDGRDEQGRAVRRGIYFVLLAGAQGRVSTRLLLLD